MDMGIRFPELLSFDAKAYPFPYRDRYMCKCVTTYFQLSRGNWQKRFQRNQRFQEGIKRNQVIETIFGYMSVF